MSSEKFYNNYLQNSYNKPSLKQDEERQHLDCFLMNFYEVLPKNKKAHVLDIGIGNAQTLRVFRKLGYENYLGVDIAKNLIEDAHKDGLLCEYVEDTNVFLDNHIGEFSFVFLSHVIEHIPKLEAAEFLEKIKNSLTDDGVLVIVTPSVQNIFYIGPFYDFTHVNFFTERSLYQVCEAGGFSNIKMFAEKTTLNIYGKGTLNFLSFFVSDILFKLARLIVNTFIRFIRFSIGAFNPKILSFNLVCICRKSDL